MIRRDYILRMIEEFIRMLARLNSLKRGQLWREASGTVDQEFERLLGVGAEAAAQWSETELLARLVRGEPTQAVREKSLMVATLFKEAGELAAAEGRPESRLLYLKGLHLLLDTIAQEEPFSSPEFVPKVETFVAALHGTELPLETHARLMQHYERIGDFGKAEDCLFALVEAAPRTPGLLELGLAFYHRLRNQTDARLAEGNLPRQELESGLADFRKRTT